MADVDQVDIAIMGNMDANISNWQSLIKDGRRIQSIQVTVTIDQNNQRSYSCDVAYSQVPTQESGAITPPTGR